MKKYLSNAFIFIVVVMPVFVLAETSVKPVKVNSPIMPGIKELKEKVASSTERMENKRDERKETLLNIARNKLDKMIKRFQATIEREEMITSKIISRIEKVKSAGGKTLEAEKYVDEARIHFSQAKSALTTLQNATSSANTLVDANTSTSTIIKTGLKKIKDMAESVTTHLKEGHKALTKALNSLKGMSSSATSTPKSN